MCSSRGPYRSSYSPGDLTTSVPADQNDIGHDDDDCSMPDYSSNSETEVVQSSMSRREVCFGTVSD